MQRVGSPAAHDETPQAELDSEQLACNLRAAGRQSACILPLFCLLGLSSLGSLWAVVNTLATLLGSNTTRFSQGPLSWLIIATNTNCSKVVMEDLYRRRVRTTHNTRIHLLSPALRRWRARG